MPAFQGNLITPASSPLHLAQHLTLFFAFYAQQLDKTPFITTSPSTPAVLI
jgi:hypothetical protein